MKLNKTSVVATVVALVTITINTKSTPAISIKNLGQSTDFVNNLFIENRNGILQVSQADFIDLRFDKNKLSLCKINQRSISEDWIDLLGKLIILFSFTSVGVMGNSVLVQRYVKLVFKDILPLFLMIFLSLSLLSIASVIASTYVSPSAPMTASLSSQNSCILK